MPSLTALDILVRPEPLNNEQWIDLIEARRRFIKPYLETYTLPELQKLQCVHYEGNLLTELSGRETVGDDRFSTSTQGIFGIQPWQAQGRIDPSGLQPTGGEGVPNYTRKVWGLTRANQWVIVTITFNKVRGYKDRGAEKITQVEIIESDLPNIIQVTQTPPLVIWQAMHAIVQTWIRRQEQLHNQLLNMHATMIMENRTLKLRLGTS